MNDSYLSLGSNMGDRLDMLQQAVRLLMEHPAIEVAGISSLYETDPVGFTEQASFLNMAVHIKTTLTALELLDVCQSIEQRLDRKRIVRWGPRTIDLDILLYNEEHIETERLVVPHPRMQERSFVLIPLLELTPTLEGFGKPDSQGVHLWKTYDGVDTFVRKS
ncbi:2-amino-4-hydroxy-6-hydroxymethyldihydropteridine diphosphokinase [Planococcus sp. N028]|uniref:2-amino-4-hydroxy-6-hydroxymethyldihydropteridine diphosphokinase n=1 Tax=Planococcus shixiaomingii TaxID=3058393 RepID=A0ABT8N7G7_9BACL|nr:MULTISPECIES: 2-amino-4-hydroxy-6-hydroxymethyldihydropteridine diphosphokinase [unclassified Planococcus (in: firmicutes)]MDN7243837.1 2-amino-4-hydroxy-6-hydroxymethyldihydropteridine diphosphokinase [Planococcus sp. N028]WKA54892.1 2-amino-4-hydroxy-6-hydroxymethyldihydropteridine diphosphokinase [Planococcus sp. N022]